MNPNIKVHAKQDGTWIEFKASDGKSWSLRAEDLKPAGPLMNSALNQWIEDRQIEAVPISHAHLRSLANQAMDEMGVIDGHDYTKITIREVAQRAVKLGSERGACDWVSIAKAMFKAYGETVKGGAWFDYEGKAKLLAGVLNSSAPE